MKMKKEMANSIGGIACIVTMVLWLSLIFFNPYSDERFETDVFISTFLFLFSPACLALIAAHFKKSSLLFIAFVWSLPISLYMMMTPGIYKWLGLTSFMYLFSAILFIANKPSKGAES